jgi:transcriptional regulator with XRE-family HTH domain
MLSFDNVHGMSNLSKELHDFFARTGIKQAELAKKSGVAASMICFLLKGRRKDMRSASADALREAMRQLSSGVTGGAGHKDLSASPGETLGQEEA